MRVWLWMEDTLADELNAGIEPVNSFWSSYSTLLSLIWRNYRDNSRNIQLETPELWSKFHCVLQIEHVELFKDVVLKEPRPSVFACMWVFGFGQAVWNQCSLSLCGASLYLFFLFGHWFLKGIICWFLALMLLQTCFWMLRMKCRLSSPITFLYDKNLV